ncbi:MAG: OmpA family protein [Bacteroidia bacterium]|nr:OmpA family protein [Bacteroidia bacterium]
MKKYILFILSSVLVISSCVSKKKFRKEQQRVANLQTDSSSTHSYLSDCNTKVTGLEKEKAEIQKELANLSFSSATAIQNSKMTIAEQSKRLQDLQTLIQSQKDIMNKLKKTMADALINFKPDELSVSVKDGKLYVSLQEKLLFKSGSAVVDPKGKEALQSLATVLNATQNIGVVIEGHTDNVPIRGKYEDNWSLSTERATAIVRILTLDYKVDAQSVAATGRGEFYPVADNATTEGKAKNRRIEIILSPNLSELFKLLNQ